MVRGIYTSATGMVAEMQRQDIVANNLANSSTTGFKSDNVTTTPFASMLLNAYDKNGVRPIGTLGLGSQLAATYTDFSDGPVIVTEKPTDLAINGNALFSVDTGNGIRYTRSGHFLTDNAGYLVTQQGFRVLGEKGPIQVKGNFQVTETGDIVQNGNVIDRLRLISTANTEKQGELLYTSSTPAQGGNYRISQGALEQSNVNTIRQMIEMVNLNRCYEANQRVLTAQDEELKRAANDLAK